MRVVLVGDYPESMHRVRGGVEAVVLYLTQHLQTYPDLQIDVVTLDKWQRGDHVAQHGNVSVHYVAKSTRPSRVSIRDNIRNMRDKIVALAPDLVHAHVTSEYAEAACQSGLPWVLTLHGIRYLEAAQRPGLVNRYRQWFVRRDELDIISKAEHMISISPFIQSVFKQQIQGQVYDIENPIASDFFDVPNQAVNGQFFFVGRIIPRKGILTLLKAFALVKEELPWVSLRIGGDTIDFAAPNDYHQQLQNYIDTADLHDSVTFIGELDRASLLSEYAACAAFVLAATLETAPMVIMEALSAGKPVITTDAGGCRYLVEDGRTGHVVPIDDHKSLAEAMIDTIRNDEYRSSMGDLARESARERFHVQRVAERTRDVYYQMLQQPIPHISHSL